MKIMLIYLLVGVVIMFFLEIFWDVLELEDPENDVELSWIMRIEVILFWPLPVGAAILGLFFNNNDNNTIGPGFGH